MSIKHLSGADKVCFIQTHICKPAAHTSILSLPSLSHSTRFQTRSISFSLFLPLITYLLISLLSRVKHVKSKQMRCHVCWRRNATSVCEDVMNIWLSLKADTFITHSSPYWMKRLTPPGILVKSCDIYRACLPPLYSNYFYCVLLKNESHTGDMRTNKWCKYFQSLHLWYSALAQSQDATGPIKCSKNMLPHGTAGGPSATEDLFPPNRRLLSRGFHHPGSYGLLIGVGFNTAGGRWR